MTIIDFHARGEALNPAASFCVTAPAGSGKTELLIQRYLALLARVEKPEQVLAITFTRKAAAEMRERILQALQDALDELPCKSPHQEKTRELALQAIAANNHRQWNIVRNSSQLNIKTIDSFCGSLTRQMPVLSQFGGQASVSDYPDDLYAEAVQELFALLDEKGGISEDLQALMIHFDNDWSKLQDLLIAMLGRREQWSTYLGVHHNPDEAEQYLLETVTSLVDDALARLERKLAPYSSELLAFQNYAAKNLGEPLLPHFPAPNCAELPAWRQFRQILLTVDKAGKWRSRVDKRMGFPTGKGEPQDYKNRLTKTVSELKEVEDLLGDLVALNHLPAIEANSSSWGMVLHLSRILPMLSAQLLLVFQRRGRVDYTQVALSALDALGTDEHPTELALRMDYQLEHLLLDEFQDTAINQYQLVSRLTRGWGEYNNANPDKPRTIMIVGDGMQSIYGFRNANVGLFLRARSEGFNGVSLAPLQLLSNFRSEQGIVDWVNSTFSLAFPARDNIARSQIQYTPATAVKALKHEPAVTLHGFRGDSAAQQEIDLICEEVQRGIEDPDCRSIAVLARTRGHLQGILAKFKQLGLDYSAQDIDSLASSHIIVDLMSLCRALVNPADTVAWMAILRAPWCGLKLADLHTLRSNSRHSSPWQSLRDETLLARLSNDGRNRVARVASAMYQARQNRDRLALRIWVEQLWLALAGPATVETTAQLDDAERFFQLLEKAELEGEGLNLQWLETRLQRLFVKAESPDSKIEVMTLHRAKGLEFDWVIIPSVQKQTRANARPLLNWDEHNGDSGHQGFLLAANDHSEPGDPSLYNYLEVQRGKKQLEETTRLLYVGATRAVSKLILTASLKYDEEKETYGNPPARSLLGRIWPTFEQQMLVHEPDAELQTDKNTGVKMLHRIETMNAQAAPDHAVQATSADIEGNIPSRSLNRSDRAIGTVVHLILEALSKLPVLPTSPGESDEHCCSKQLWQFELRQLGLNGNELHHALKVVENSVSTVLNDKEGRWVLSCAHTQASSELALTYIGKNDRPAQLIIDRTFVDAATGTRWLVDYKNSRPAEGEPQQHFLQREEQKYLSQLFTYRAALDAMGDEPVSCALYFTALGHFHPIENTAL